MEIDKETIDAIFAAHSTQYDVLVGLYRLVYDGSAPDRPAWETIGAIDGWPTVGPVIFQYLCRKFWDFDKVYHREVMPGIFWMTRSWPMDHNLGDWEIVPAPATVEEELVHA